VARDRKNALALNGDGWRVMEIWECQIHKDPDLMKRIAAFLDYPFVAKSSNLK
jgi:G:T-mismatch repair DNA endonuclease (very short patch repair protein)